jgi:hypothetical protein
MARNVIQRTEMNGALLDLGGAPLDLTHYATTGLRVLAVGPSGGGKTNLGLLIGEQLAEQGWVSIFVDPESEIASLYGEPVTGPEDLRRRLAARTQPIIVVSAKDAAEFIPYGEVILEAADEHRKPIFLMIDEGQVFSSATSRKEDLGDATDLINEFAQRGRKRALDLFLTAHSFTGSVNRAIFRLKNLTLIGGQSDPTMWSTLAPLFRASKLEFADLAALAPGEFICFSPRGIEKVRTPMAKALAAVAEKAKIAEPALPATFTQWDRAMRRIPTDRLEKLTDPVVRLLGSVAGLTSQQMISGARALQDELDTRQ